MLDAYCVVKRTARLKASPVLRNRKLQLFITIHNYSRSSDYFNFNYSNSSETYAFFQILSPEKSVVLGDGTPRQARARPWNSPEGS